jgi:hypothetical protein
VNTIDDAEPSLGFGPKVGTTLGERYRLSGPIAAGGMGEVWVATDRVLRREVAIKILRQDLVGAPGFLQRFRAEAWHTAALSHPGVASTYDYCEEWMDGRLVAYLVMELVRGEPLSALIARDGAMPVGVALTILANSADALSAAHRVGIIHRDVKPANILIVSGGAVKLTDFGIARASSSLPITEVGQVIGTARYMSPEQAAGRETSSASDVYALGVVGYEMLAGVPPFTADSPAALALAHIQQPPPPLPNSVPAPVRAAIAGALSKDPSVRPRDARSFAVHVRRLIAGLDAPTEPFQPLPPPVDGDRHDVTELADTATPAPTALLDRHQIVGQGLIGVDPRPSRRRRRRLLLAATCIAGLALLGAMTRGDHQLVGATRVPAPTTSTITTQLVAATPAVTVAVAPETVVGQPAVDVATALTTAGLVVRQQSVPGNGTPAGIVVAVDRTGMLPIGTTVLLSVSDGAPATTAAVPAQGNGKGKGKGKNKG